MKEDIGKLYLVSTPIGNLEDITHRAIRILDEVDLIAAEDTRRTRILLTRYEISKPTTSFFAGNEKKKKSMLIARLKDGINIALVSDAGTPGISDPAYSVVRDAIELGIEVVPIPGVSAVITALSASGIATDRFLFEGFLPRKKGKRGKVIKSWEKLERTVVFYESPHRITSTLKEIVELIGDRNVALARELTKKFEEIYRGKLSMILERLGDKKLKGEIAVVLSGQAE